MPYHSVCIEKGESETIRCPSAPRNEKAKKRSMPQPSNRTPKESFWNMRPLLCSPPVVQIVQNAKIAERYISVHQSGPDQPIFDESGVSLTIKIPINNSDTVRSSTCATVFQSGSPFWRRDPNANGIDIPRMKRNAGKTRSTNVI